MNNAGIKEAIDQVWETIYSTRVAGHATTQAHQAKRLQAYKNLAAIKEALAKSIRMPEMTPEILQALREFNESNNCHSYQFPPVPALALHQLEQSGAICHLGMGVYEVTEFGKAVLSCSDEGQS